VFTVDVTNNGGASWTNVEVVGPVGLESSGGWFEHRFRLADFVAPTANVKLRFVAEDAGSGSIVEAAVDDLEVSDLDCTSGPGAPSCFGTGCPCGNDSAATGCVNSTGSGAVLSGAGSTSVAADDLVLTATGAPPTNTGLFFMGGTTFAPVFVGDGLACTGGIFRYFPSTVSPAGVHTLSNPVANAFAGAIQAGHTRHFQSWTRDVLCGPPPAPCPTPCGMNSNLSNAYTVVFTP
jgi:hypothetical protein